MYTGRFVNFDHESKVNHILHILWIRKKLLMVHAIYHHKVYSLCSYNKLVYHFGLSTNDKQTSLN